MSADDEQRQAPASAVAPPVDIKANTQAGRLELTWGDGAASQLSFVALRNACPCAGCIDEWTGQRTLDPATIPADIRITAMQLVGNYALKITWSDGHDTGLYTWKVLRVLTAR